MSDGKKRHRAKWHSRAGDLYYSSEAMGTMVKFVMAMVSKALVGKEESMGLFRSREIHGIATDVGNFRGYSKSMLTPRRINSYDAAAIVSRIK